MGYAGIDSRVKQRIRRNLHKSFKGEAKRRKEKSAPSSAVVAGSTVLPGPCGHKYSPSCTEAPVRQTAAARIRGRGALVRLREPREPAALRRLHGSTRAAPPAPAGPP